MKVCDVYNFLNLKYPFNTAEAFDNVGLLVGEKEAEVLGIVVCLDCTDESINLAINNKANLIITHHPIIFDPLKSVTENSPVYKCIQNGISVISAHTNLDLAKSGVNDCLCEALGFKNKTDYVCSDGYTIKLAKISKTSADLLAAHVKDKLGFPVRYNRTDRQIQTVAVCSGSGGNFLGDVINAGADAFITADIKHNVFYDAERFSVCVIDGGHFATEDVVVAPLCKALKEQFPDITVSECHYTPIKFL